jgi:tRNA pseudouridine55 synthase
MTGDDVTIPGNSLVRMFGILNIHKPSGPTSRDCVNQIQRLVKPKKVGHGGTLDPIASGVLLVMVGPAVRLTEEIHQLDKEYIGLFQLGVTSPSADRESEMQPTPGAGPIDRIALEAVIPEFVGQITQVPPLFSAIRIQGRRAHEIARSGETAEIPSRQVRIDEVELLSFDYPMMTLRIVCGTGTYIRSLGRDIARRLNSDAVMLSLERTRIGPFSISSAVRPTDLASVHDVRGAIRSATEALPDHRLIQPDQECLTRLMQGQRVTLDVEGPFTANSRLGCLDADCELHSLVSYDVDRAQWKVFKYFPREA